MRPLAYAWLLLTVIYVGMALQAFYIGDELRGFINILVTAVCFVVFRQAKNEPRPE